MLILDTNDLRHDFLCLSFKLSGINPDLQRLSLSFLGLSSVCLNSTFVSASHQGNKKFLFQVLVIPSEGLRGSFFLNPFQGTGRHL